MIYKFTIVFLSAFGIGYCAVPDLLPPSELSVIQIGQPEPESAGSADIQGFYLIES